MGCSTKVSIETSFVIDTEIFLEDHGQVVYLYNEWLNKMKIIATATQEG